MKIKILLGVFIVLCSSSCLMTMMYRSDKLLSDSEEIIAYKKLHSSIEKDMSMSEVKSIMGEPTNRQFDQDLESWQYCKTGMDVNQYFGVSFENKMVTGINTYSKLKGEGGSCYKCERCFNEVLFYPVEQF